MALKASVHYRRWLSKLIRQTIQPPAGPDIFGLGSHPVLIFQSLTCCREQVQQMTTEREEHSRQMKESEWEEPSDANEVSQFLPLGGWASNCEPKGFPLPCEAVDAVIYNDGGGDIYFVDELRLAFRGVGSRSGSGVYKSPISILPSSTARISRSCYHFSRKASWSYRPRDAGSQESV